jgi:sulfate transport system substrate-binding protein
MRISSWNLAVAAFDNVACAAMYRTPIIGETFGCRSPANDSNPAWHARSECSGAASQHVIWRKEYACRRQEWGAPLARELTHAEAHALADAGLMPFSHYRELAQCNGWVGDVVATTQSQELVPVSEVSGFASIRPQEKVRLRGRPSVTQMFSSEIHRVMSRPIRLSDTMQLPSVGLIGAYAALASTFLFILTVVAFAQTTLLNVSYDPTRELYRAFNVEFGKHWQNKTGKTVAIRQSHGGSGAQARAVIDGLDADVVTLAMQSDIDAIVKNCGKIANEWRRRLPNNSAPYTSTMVFLVRKGNPKNLKDWDDLVKPGVSVITPNPKTSGAARWNYLAAWAYASEKFAGDAGKIKTFVAALYKNVAVLDTAARGSTTTFVQRGIGDILLAWENEAFLAIQTLGPEKFEIVVPSISTKAEPVVAVVDANVDKKGTREVAQAYLEYLYSPAGQRIAAKNYYRPSTLELADPEDAARFPKVKLITIDDPLFGGWSKAQPEHFGDGGTFDQIYKR